MVFILELCLRITAPSTTVVHLERQRLNKVFQNIVYSLHPTAGPGGEWIIRKHRVGVACLVRTLCEMWLVAIPN